MMDLLVAQFKRRLIEAGVEIEDNVRAKYFSAKFRDRRLGFDLLRRLAYTPQRLRKK